jgi:hypothetical protein
MQASVLTAKLRRRVKRAAWLVFVIVSCLRADGLAVTWAETSDPLASVRPLLTAAQQALDKKDFEGAEKQLTKAYQQSPQPQLLCWFGRWASRQGAAHKTQALDYYRRCLEPRAETAEPELLSEARAALAVPAAPDEQVELQIIASIGDTEFLWLDGHLVGRFPLSRPLLSTPGKHALRRGRTPEAATEKVIALSPDQPIYLTSLRDGWDVGFMELFLVLLGGPGVADVQQRAALWRILEAALERDNAVAVAHQRVDPRMTAEQHLPGCAGALPCLAGNGQKARVSHVLDLTVRPEGSDGFLLHIDGYDVRTDEVTFAQADRCAACTPARLEQKVAELVRLARRKVIHAVGNIEIRSTPAARLRVDGRDRGMTPRRLTLWTGAHDVSVSRETFFSIEQPLQLEQGEQPPLELSLKPLPLSGGEKLMRVGRWAFTFAGLVAVGAGVGLFLVDGQAQLGTDPLMVLSTRDAGFGLLAGGSAALLTGVVLFAIDGSRPLRRKAPWR